MSSFLESALTKMGSMPKSEGLPTTEVSAGVSAVSKAPKRKLAKKAPKKVMAEPKESHDVSLLKKRAMMK